MDDPKGTHSDYYASYGYNPNAEIIEASSGDYRATRKLFLHGPKYKNWKTFHWQYDNNSSIESGISQKRGTGRAWDGDNTLFLNDEVGKTTRASWMEIKDNWIMNFKIETENYGHFDLTTFLKHLYSQSSIRTSISIKGISYKFKTIINYGKQINYLTTTCLYLSFCCHS